MPSGNWSGRRKRQVAKLVAAVLWVVVLGWAALVALLLRLLWLLVA